MNIAVSLITVLLRRRLGFSRNKIRFGLHRIRRVDFTRLAPLQLRPLCDSAGVKVGEGEGMHEDISEPTTAESGCAPEAAAGRFASACSRNEVVFYGRTPIAAFPFREVE